MPYKFGYNLIPAPPLSFDHDQGRILLLFPDFALSGYGNVPRLGWVGTIDRITVASRIEGKLASQELARRHGFGIGASDDIIIFPRIVLKIEKLFRRPIGIDVKFKAFGA